MSVLHRIHSAQGADAPVVFALLGVESLVRRIEASTASMAEIEPAGALDGPGLVLLGLMSLHHKWRAVRRTMTERSADERPTETGPLASPRSPSGSLLR